MRRVLVIGSPGSGKSTLAAELARRTGLPLIHLDQEYWKAGWVEPDKAEWKAHVGRLTAGDCWVIDGNYGGSLEQRLTRADTVIDLEFPAWLCVWRILRRLLTWRGRVRADMAAGCPERFNLELLVYAASFPLASRKRLAAKLARFDGKVIRLRSSADVREFLRSLPTRVKES